MSDSAFTKLKKVFGTIRWGQRSERDMTQTISLQVHLDYDDEACVWFVAKSDIPGLSLEAESAPKLVERVLAAAPELLELNAHLLGHAASQEEPRLNMPELIGPVRRPRLNVMPVFDRPLELACAW